MAAMLAVVYHKVKRAHVASYRMLDEIDGVRKEVGWLYAEIQALLALERLLGLEKPLPPLRGWAGSPDFLLVLANAVLERKPSVVVECGSGSSTLVIARCLERNGRGHVYSMDHDATYAQRTRDLLARHGLSTRATVLTAPLETRTATGETWYRDDALPADLAPIELLVVDGPPAMLGRMMRAPAFPRLRSRAAPGLVIVIDDADRPDERAMVDDWCRMEPSFVKSVEAAEKGLVLLERRG
ncbi:MAG: class I SAM-dependent methyltransferase [Burkholderiales bacterium]